MCKAENEAMSLLVKAIVSIESEEECRSLLEDLMTRKEAMDMAQRLLVAKMLSEQAVYTKIASETGASTATISRVKRCLDYGSGGYNAILSKMEEA